MQPRALDQILAELNPIYQPSVDLYRQQQSLIPGQIDAEVKGLDAKKDNAFDQILGGARQRGLGFAGIPIAEQAKYTASDYLPAVARVRQQGQQQAMGLEEAIIGVNRQKQEAAMNMRQYEQQRYDQYMAEQRALAEQRRQAAAAAAANNSWMKALQGGAVKGAAAPAKKQIGGVGTYKKPDGSVGYEFRDQVGNTISPYAYANLNKINFLDVLGDMAVGGDAYARQALNSMKGVLARPSEKDFQWLYQIYKPTPAAPAQKSNPVTNAAKGTTIGGQPFMLYKR